MRILPGQIFITAWLWLASSSAMASPPAAALPTAAHGVATEVAAAETEQLQRLYEAALAEGGALVVWAGGDAPNQLDWLVDGFRQRFPGMLPDVTVDLSKFHDLRIDDELDAGTLTPDVAMLQTTFDFDKWKQRGVLMHYKPVGFAQQKPGYADVDGAYITAFNYGFLPSFAAALAPARAPVRYADFLQPHFKGRLILTYPHDDDAVMFVYSKLEQRYGTGFLQALAAQRPRLVRGTAAAAYLVGRPRIGQGGYGPVHLGNVTGYASGPGQPGQHWIPQHEPFIVWNQRAAIFQAARHPAAARLWLSWLGSAEFQSGYSGWRARADVGEAEGLPPLESLPQVDVHEFTRWMADRANIAQIRLHMRDIFGPVVGESPLRDLQLLSLMGLGPEAVVALPEPERPPY